jgi:hypothetical protein
MLYRARFSNAFALLAVLAPLTSCATSADGPTPAVTSVMPMAICDAQHPVLLKIMGSGFSPTVNDVLTGGPHVVLPGVRFSLSGMPSAAPVEIIPTDIEFVSASELDVTIPMGTLAPTAAGQPAAQYDVSVVNPTGKSGTLAMGLTVEPPPTVTGVVPPMAPTNSMPSLTINGTGFLPGATATLTMGTGTPITLSGITVAADGTSLTGTADLTGATPGAYDVTVTNTDGCSFTLSGGFTVTGNMFALTGIEPPFGCTCSDTTVHIFSAGAFVSTPVVTMVPHGQATPVTVLKRVAFLSSSELSAVVPAGLTVGGYDVTVTNPPSSGGSSGTLMNGFTVVTQPVPTVCSVAPAQGTTQADTAVVITGASFRAGVTVDLAMPSATPGTPPTVVAGATTGTPVVNSGGTQITGVTIKSTTLAVGNYLVRVTDPDSPINAYDDFAGFVVVNPSAKLSGWAAGTSLTGAPPVGRALHGTITAQDDLGNDFIYVLGGEEASGPVATVEDCKLGGFGDMGAFFDNANSMNKSRVGLGAVAVPVQGTSVCAPPTTYVYALGGSTDYTATAGTADGSVERALVLRTKDAPVVMDPGTAGLTGTLAAGTWYYEVSAVLAASDPEAPGEGLPSEEAIAGLRAVGGVSLTWNSVTQNAAGNSVTVVGYRIYRTDAADGTSGTEHLLDTIDCTTGTPCAGTTVTYHDDGSKSTMPAMSPLPEGSLGEFVNQTQTITPRFEHGAAVAADSAGASYVFVAGGRTDNMTGSATNILASVEAAPIMANGDLGTFASAGTLASDGSGAGVANFSFFVENHQNSALPAASGDVLWVWGGEDTTGAVAGHGSTNALQSAEVTTATGMAALTFANSSLKPKGQVGGFGAVIGNEMFMLGGGSTVAQERAASVGSAGQKISLDTAGAVMGSVSSVAVQPPAQAEGGIAVGPINVYLIAGQNGTPAAPIASSQVAVQ